MFLKKRSYSLALKMVLIGMYLPFVLVQLYLKFTVPVQLVSTGTGSYGYSKSGSNARQNIKSCHLLTKNRLNTRYQPATPFCLSNSISKCLPNFIFISKTDGLVLSNKLQALHSDQLHRGPPAV